jgi:hypothetical protein
MVEFGDNPVGIKRFVRNQAAKLDAFDERRHAYRVIPTALNIDTRPLAGSD